jgi:hypothetical protein
MRGPSYAASAFTPQPALPRRDSSGSSGSGVASPRPVSASASAGSRGITASFAAASAASTRAERARLGGSGARPAAADSSGADAGDKLKPRAVNRSLTGRSSPPLGAGGTRTVVKTNK